MKAMFAAASALVCVAGNAQAAALQACNLTVDVIDTDPRGTNVREAPGGRIVAALKTSPDPLAADWIEAHVIGQSGDWFLIDGAKDVGDDEKTIFRGRGYLHRSVLGASGLWNGAALWSDHDETSPLVARATAGDQSVLFLGCWGQFAKVRIMEGTGWTRSLCLNGRTTCA